MEITALGIEGAWLATSSTRIDSRGYFLEWFKTDEVFSKTGLNFKVQQANISLSKKGVIRGIHYSLVPGGQSKWVSCVNGSILDVVVDIRPKSPTYKKIEYIKMESGDGKSLLVGPGLGHGFISLEDETQVSYLLNSPYSPMHEFGISPMDHQLNINWQLDLHGEIEVEMSSKDLQAPNLAEREIEGNLP